jgi:glycosyltransferase involved in cell wall biosynthesis
MKITVAICTWNRAKLLDQTLTQMHPLRIPEGVDWELLVVNNNCTDDTDAVLERHASALPLRRLFESKQGHSNARNFAIDHAQGDLLLWTDDDVLVPDNWLAEYVQVATDYPDATFFGGPVRPWWEAPPPKWIQRHLQTIGYLWALLDLGDDVRPLTPQEWVHGANMGFRIAVIRHRCFDPSLGHIGSYFQGGDETTLLQELQRAGNRGVWIGTVPVQHFVTKDRLTTRYAWNLIEAIATSSPETKYDYRHIPSLMGHPRWLLRKYWSARVESLLRAPFRDHRWLKSFMEAAKFSGILRGLQNRRGLENLEIST